MVDERVIDRIRKMLALANDKGASEGERDNALRMAHATLAKYNLDIAMVEKSKGGKKVTDDQEPRQVHIVNFYGRPWARTVAKSVGKMLFCEVLYRPATKAKETAFLFVGRHSNAVSAAILAEFLITSITREGRRRQREVDAGNIWFRSFAAGAAIAIDSRVELLVRAPTGSPAPPVATPVPNGPHTSPGTAVALASVYDRERAANRAFIDAARGEAPKRKGRTGKTDYVSDAVNEGVAYGGTVSLDKQLGEG